MSKRNDINNSFEESLRSALQGAVMAPSEDLWSRIEVSRTRAVRGAMWLSVAKWGGAVAASVALAIAANVLFMPNLSTQTYESRLAEFIPVAGAPISLEPIKLQSPKMIAHFAVDSLESEQEAAIEIVSISSEEEPSGDEPKQAEVEVYSKEDVDVQRPSVVISKPIPSSIDHSQIVKKGRARRYTIPAAIVAAAAGGAGIVELGGGVKSNSLDLSTPPLGDSYTMVSGYEIDGFVIPSSDVSAVTRNVYNPTSISHKMPLSYSLNIAKRLGDRWSIESGVDYTRLSSTLTMSHTPDPFEQVVQFVGVPLRVNYDILSLGRFSLYAGAGGELERCVSAKLNSLDYSEVPWHTSAEAALGAQYNITNWLGAYVEPQAQYYFTKSRLTTIRTDSKLNFNLQFGLRFVVGK